MLAFLAFEELGLRLISGAGLHCPIVGFPMAAFWTFCIRERQGLDLLINDRYLLFRLYFFPQLRFFNILINIAA